MGTIFSENAPIYNVLIRDRVIVHLGLNVSSSALVGAWSMAVMLWQQFEYYN